jgi:nitric oxide reductase
VHNVTSAPQGVVTLLQHPKQLDELKKDPSLAKGTVEELLRYHTASALATRRVAMQDVSLAGKVRALSRDLI